MSILRKIYHKLFWRQVEYKKYIGNLLLETNQNVKNIQNQLNNMKCELDFTDDKIKTILKEIDKVNDEYLFINEKSEILIVGFYGAPNLGDELMLSTLLSYLDCDNLDVTVLLCDNYDYKINDYPKVKFIHYPKTRYDFNILAEKFDYIIFGGGAIIDDKQYLKQDSFKYDLGTILIDLSLRGIAFNKKMIYLGLSSNYNLSNQEYIRYLGYIIENAEFFSVRDPNSKKTILKAIPTLDEKQIVLINDLVMSNTKLTNPINLNKGRNIFVGIIWVCTEENMEVLRKLLFHIKTNYPKYHIKLIPFYDYVNNDINLYNKIFDKLEDKDNIEILPYNNTIEEIIYTFDKCDYIISMRYHATLISLARNINTISICYDKHTHYLNKISYINDLFKNKNNFSFVELMNDEKNYDLIIKALNTEKKSRDLTTELIHTQNYLKETLSKYLK